MDRRMNESRDIAQRVVTLTYSNIRMNKSGDWIGTPVTEDRSVNDLVLVDNALNDSMLGSWLAAKKDESREKEKIANDDEISKNNIMNDDKALEATNPETSNIDSDDSINTVEKDDDNKEAEEDHEPGIVIDENDIVL